MKSPGIAWISKEDPPESFPDVERAFDVPDGLLAAGGDLSLDRLLYAYRNGIFPWYSEGQPILWWSPDPRCVFRPERLHQSRRLLRFLRSSRFTVTFNRSFADVIQACAQDRPGQDGTWITTDMLDAYLMLHQAGWAHSVEVWQGEQLVGGMYGLAIGKVFFGESMFSRTDNASKAAMRALCAVLRNHEFALLDGQIESPHLISMGAEMLPRRVFVRRLRANCSDEAPFHDWPDQRCPITDFD